MSINKEQKQDDKMKDLMDRIKSLNQGTLKKEYSEEKYKSQIRQWPLQLDLSPIKAEHFHGKDLQVAADCTAFAYRNFHEDFMIDKITIIACQKLKEESYVDKLRELIENNDFKSISLVRMENPCCGQLESSVKEAIAKSGKDIDLKVDKIMIDGRRI